MTKPGLKRKTPGAFFKSLVAKYNYCDYVVIATENFPLQLHFNWIDTLNLNDLGQHLIVTCTITPSTL